MCWPRERPATHAAAGAAARGALIFWFGGFFCGWTGSRCGGMCWPVDRPATHAAAGAAARGALIFCFGDCFTRSGVTARGGFLFGGFRTSGAATAVTENNRRELFHPRRCAVSCEAALCILSNGKSCPPCGRGCVCSGGDCGSGSAKRSFAGRIPKRSLGTT